MFERVIAQTIQKIGAEVLRDQSLVPLISILEDERIPNRLKPFFETEVSWWLYNESLARAANKRFDYDHPELSSLLSYLEQVQFRHARFEREDFQTVLDSAVKLTYNFLCRPQTTLKWYIFRGEPVKPLREVMLRFGAFADYDYFRTVFSEWVDRKQSERPTFDAISSTEFERVIRRIDDQILLSCTVEDLLALMDPFFEFVGETDEYHVPVDALIVFFDDKNIKKLVDYLEGFRARGNESVSREDFLALLDELLTSAEDEPEADFSTVYQNDELDDVVRQHLQVDGTEQMVPSDPASAPVKVFSVGTAPSAAPQEPAADDVVGEEPEQVGKDEIESVLLPTDISAEDIGRHLSFINTASSNIAASLDDPFESEIDVDSDAEVDESDDDPYLPSGIGGQIDRSVREAETAADAASAFSRTSDGQAAERSTPSTPVRGFDDPFADDEDDDEEDDDLESPFSETHNGETAPDESIPDTLFDDDDDDLLETASLATTAPIGGDAGSGMRTVATYGDDGAEETSKEDVRRFIDAMLERKVVKKVFLKDRAAYEEALDRINAADNWRTASQILDELFIRFDVDPYSRTAIRFTDSVYGRYLPKSR